MKSTVTTNNTQVFERTYPYLGIHKGSTQMIILFTSKGYGVIVNNHPLGMGHKSNIWLESEFELFNGKVTLEN